MILNSKQDGDEDVSSRLSREKGLAETRACGSLRYQEGLQEDEEDVPAEWKKEQDSSINEESDVPLSFMK